MYEISARRVTRCLFLAVAILTLLHIIFPTMRAIIPALDLGGFSDRFNFNAESSIPTVFSVLLLLSIGALAFDIGSKLRPMNAYVSRHWRLLSWLFVYLAFDEGAQIHESVGSIVRMQVESTSYENSALFYTYWVPIGVIVLTILGIYFQRFFRAMPRDLFRIFLLGIVLWVLGAIVIEFTEVVVRQYGFWWTTALLSTVEEIFEKLGAIIFLYGALLYRATEIKEHKSGVAFKK
jgi:hypothetical protein